MTDWVPIKSPSLPTAQVKVGKRKLGSAPNILGIQAKGTTAFFEADIVDDTGISSTSFGRDLEHHPNVAALYDGLSSSDDITLLTSTGKQDIPACDTAYIEIHSGNEQTIKEFLRQTSYLLHRGLREVCPKERTPEGFGKFEFTVHGVEPNQTTVRVTADTGFSEPPTASNSVGGSDGSSSSQSDDYDLDELIEIKTPERSFQEDAIGLDNVRPVVTQLGRIYQPEIRRNFEQQVGELDTGSSLLLFGPPGCGKTLATECIAYELKHRCMQCGSLECSQHSETVEDFHGPVKLMEVNSAGISDRYVGEAPSKLETVFEKAYDTAEDDNFVVLFFDEAESVVAERSDTDQQYIVELTNTFLREVSDQALSEKNILLVAATNYPHEIDTAAMNRFTQTEFIGPPRTGSEMAKIWEIEAGDQANANRLDYDDLGEASVGYVPREISNIRKEYVHRDYVGDDDIDGQNPPPVTTQDYLDKLDDTEPSVIDQYIVGLRKNALDLEGYDNLQDFIQYWSNNGTDDESSTATAGSGSD